jgi:hypothetical protein
MIYYKLNLKSVKIVSYLHNKIKQTKKKMEAIIVKAKSKKLAEEVVKKLLKIQGLQIQTSKTWLELDKSLPNIDMTEDEIMKEVRTVRYGQA